MPTGRTEVTELATALGTLGYPSVDEAVAARPDVLIDVPDGIWDALDAAQRSGRYRVDFEGAFRNGRALLDATWGLRGRRPLRVEWKGPHRAPAYEFLPADLRIDHVFLVSCKHDSHVLANTSPGHLFDDLQWGRVETARRDWYEEVAPGPYQAFYEAVRQELAGERRLPALVGALTPDDRRVLKSAFARRWPASLQGPYEGFAFAVAEASARRWRAAASTRREEELALWRLLRMGAAPYFLLGESGGERLRLRVATPWDWRRQFELLAFAVAPRPAAQPRVDWEARVRERAGGGEWSVGGYAEIRWSHGRFSGAPEAKVQLVTPHSEVPGYHPLT